MLIRDVSDERYPYLDEDTSKAREDRGRWRVFEFAGCNSDGVHLKWRRQFAYIDPDGERWDYAERMNLATPNSHEDPWCDDRRGPDADHTAAFQLWDALPPEQKGWFEVMFVLPYETIIDVDDTGDEVFDGPQILVEPFSADRGPFRDYTRLSLERAGTWYGHTPSPDEEKRVLKFDRKETDGSRKRR
ncbi:MAG: hypothetical protein ABUS57_02820 [Pseudomonadota bacterium]